MGFLAVAVFVVAAILSASRSDAPESNRAKLKLPTLIANPRDLKPPHVLFAGVAQPDVSALETGATMLVFADGTSAASLRTANLAVEMHQRLRPHPVRVVLVLPRELLTSAPTLDDSDAKARLEALGVTTDIDVFLDPRDAQGPGQFRRGRWRYTDDRNGALLLRDGAEWMRVTPPPSTNGLLPSHLAPLVNQLATSYPATEDGPK
jgi:hypothetical protein